MAVRGPHALGRVCARLQAGRAMEDSSDKMKAPRAPGKGAEPNASIKYEAVVDWEHYHTPRAEQIRLTSVSVGEMYWRVVGPIRDQVRSSPRGAHPRTRGAHRFAAARVALCSVQGVLWLPSESHRCVRAAYRFPRLRPLPMGAMDPFSPLNPPLTPFLVPLHRRSSPSYGTSPP